MFRKTVFKNGFRIITSELPQRKSFSANLLIAAGSRYENKKNNGISHFLEHLVFRGTEKWPSEKEVMEAIEGIGGDQNAGTSIDFTRYWVKIPQEYFSLGIEFLFQIAFSSLLEEKEIEKEKPVIIEEINMYLDNPRWYVRDLIHKLIWRESSLGYSILGGERNILRMRRKDFLDYKKNLYLPQNMVLSVVSSLNHQRIVGQVENFFVKLPKAKPKRFQRAKTKQKKPQILIYPKKTDQVHLCLGIKDSKFSHQSLFETPLEILNTLLGGKASSRLFLNIRSQKGLCYYIESGINTFEEGGSLIIHAGLNIKKIKEAISAILEELKKIKEEKVSKEELEKTKRFIIGNLELQIEETDFLSSWYGLQELLYPKVKTPQEKIKEVERIFPEDIQRAAQEIFKKEKLNLAMIGPFEKKQEKEFLRLLERF